MDGPRSNPAKSVIKRINDLKEELLELEEHPEMIPEMLRDEMLLEMKPHEMSTKISLLITYISPNETQKRSRNNDMLTNSKNQRTRGGRYRNKRRRTLKRTRKYKW